MYHTYSLLCMRENNKKSPNVHNILRMMVQYYNYLQPRVNHVMYDLYKNQRKFVYHVTKHNYTPRHINCTIKQWIYLLTATYLALHLYSEPTDSWDEHLKVNINLAQQTAALCVQYVRLCVCPLCPRLSTRTLSYGKSVYIYIYAPPSSTVHPV